MVATKKQRDPGLRGGDTTPHTQRAAEKEEAPEGWERMDTDTVGDQESGDL